MTRHTSKQAWDEIQQSGLLGKRQRHAYNVLYKDGPLTGNELSSGMGMPGQWKRCSELKKRGLVIEVGERPCRITGKMAILWDVTANMPVKAAPGLKGNKKIKVLEEELMKANEENSRLRTELARALGPRQQSLF